MTEPIIEFKDFSFKYNSQAEPTLKNINLKINKGEKILKFFWLDLQAAANPQLVAALMVLFQISIKVKLKENV